jgi:hypothetical protein
MSLIELCRGLGNIQPVCKLAKSVSLLLLVFILGCQSTPRDLSSKDLSKLTTRHGLGHLYYTGSDASYHYFTTKYFLEPTKYYRLHKFDYILPKEMAITTNRQEWIPYEIDLGKETEGFNYRPTDTP